MRKNKGFVSLYLILILIAAFIGLILVSIFKQNERNTSSINIFVTPTPYSYVIKNSTSAPVPTSTVSPESVATKGTYQFYLANYNNYKYEFEWEAYKMNDKNANNIPESVWVYNLHSPVKIVKTNLSNGSKTLVKNHVIDLLSANVEPYIDIIQQPNNTNLIYYDQGLEGTDGHHKRLLNFESGEVIEFYPKDNVLNCNDLPPKEKNQEFIIFSCEFVNKNKEGNSANYEKLFIYNLLTNQTKELDKLEQNEFYSCDFGQGYFYKYEYLTSNKINLSICNNKLEVQRTKIYNL